MSGGSTPVGNSRNGLGTETGLNRFDRCDESIAFLGKRFEHPRFQRIVVKRFPDLFYGNIDGVLKLDKLAVFPKRFLNFVST